jgi:hypothetical protein
MAIKKTINGVAPITKIKAPNLKKAVVGIKKDEPTIKPQEEVIEAVETVSTEISTPLIPEIIVQEPILDITTVGSQVVESTDFEKETKLAKEQRFAKIALCIGVGFLVLMILNKK